MGNRNNVELGGRFWFAAPGPGSIGHGRIELLERIHRTGSISQAARAMGMSYKAAWDAVAAMNNLADSPLIETSTGGRGGGGTRLTPRGLKLVEVFRAAEGEFEAFLARLGAGISDFEHFYALMRKLGMKTSARNELAGRVKAIHRGGVNCEVVVDIGDDELVAIITNESAVNLGLREGGLVYALIKASWMILADPDEGRRTSARNRLEGTVIDVRRDEVNAEVALMLPGGKQLTAVITTHSADALSLAPGVQACALVKASHVILAIDA